MNAAPTFLCENTIEREAGAPRVFVAAFGKHPAWNDHINDLGLVTQTLAEVRRLIYLEGIASQIDTGAWDRLDAESLFPWFDHAFIWQRSDEIVAGLICESRDGKGRTRYPLILCVHAMGVPLKTVAGEFLPMLELGLAECCAASSVADVEGLVAKTQGLLRDAAENVSRKGKEPLPSLSGHPEFGPGDEGIYRIIYHLRSQFEEYGPRKPADRNDGRHPPAAHIRVPQLENRMAIGCLLWIRFLRSQLDPRAPLLLLWPREAHWVDAIVGIPEGADFFPLKANTKAVPLASDVPYELNQEFRLMVQADMHSAERDSSFAGSSEAEASLVSGQHGLKQFERFAFLRLRWLAEWLRKRSSRH